MEGYRATQKINILKDSRNINPKSIISRTKVAEPLQVFGVNQMECNKMAFNPKKHIQFVI
jgi:hypothetical protein